MIPPNSQPHRGPARWHFDIDGYINPFFPPSALPRLPSPVAHFLGYRTHAPTHQLGNLAMIFWAAIGVFSSIAIIGAVMLSIPEFQSRGVPTVIGSFGAAAVLDFYTIESPLAQPRNAILGQAVSAAVGISLCKLFALSPNFESVRWLGASLACACATALMALTGTVHPPAGATALMVVLDPTVAALGWFVFLPLLLGCALMLAVAVLVNNVQRRFPYYWWSPGETGAYWRRRREEKGGGGVETEVGRMEKGEKRRGGSGAAGSTGSSRKESLDRRRRGEEEESGSSSNENLDVGGELARMVSVLSGRGGEIVIRRGMVKIPDGLSLRPEEILSLETLSERL
ncbi:HPP family-domain-containing protein [Chaetomidium leptoderma]|uniref:HPP family-domain-containing protein n=1 Tax=Chaetomidium leptoderma TaxID=669021 RepID=A0AAN6VNK9_9PEZI|nr:HPP family-domain-containing protein [Chaetomidium leptoderma]